MSIPNICTCVRTPLIFVMAINICRCDWLYHFIFPCIFDQIYLLLLDRCYTSASSWYALRIPYCLVLLFLIIRKGYLNGALGLVFICRGIFISRCCLHPLFYLHRCCHASLPRIELRTITRRPNEYTQ